jgi:hypothetical protein
MQRRGEKRGARGRGTRAHANGKVTHTKKLAHNHNVSFTAHTGKTIINEKFVYLIH